MDAYIRAHLKDGMYRGGGIGHDRYESVAGWVDYRLGPHIIYAHRTTDYRTARFSDALHMHDYCEILIPIRGEVQYVSGDRTELPERGRFFVIPPRRLHTTRLLSAGIYERHVLYIARDAFRSFSSELSCFFSEHSAVFAGTPDERDAARMEELLSEIDRALSKDMGDFFSAYAAVAALLLILKNALSDESSGEMREQLLPEPLSAIRRYIESEYASIVSIEALAEHFYYSREYVTRLFRRYYNLSPGEYLEQCRIRAAEERILAGNRIADVCFAVGYRSMSAFSAAFRRVTGQAPSEARKNSRNIHK